MSGPGLYDPTNIMNASMLDKCQKEGWIKMGFYLFSFFFYIYGWIFMSLYINIYTQFQDGLLYHISQITCIDTIVAFIFSNEGFLPQRLNLKL